MNEASATSAPPPAPLPSLGRYLLLRPLAEGGMGALFLAYDPRRAAPVVIKRLGQRTSSELRARLLDEMAITRQLVHPQLVEYLDAGEVDDELYLALAHVPGRDLHALCTQIWQRGGRVEVSVALWIARQLCLALDYAHTRPGLDFIHRDVTPTNVLIGYDGSVRLADHGLAKTSTKGFRTVPGVATGTLGFVSPEQLAAQTLDPRTDVYGVGAVLWFMLTGRSPADPLDLNRSLVAQRRLAHFSPGLAPEVEALVYRALADDRTQRHPSAAALGDAIFATGACAEDGASALASTVASSFPGEAERSEAQIAELLVLARAQVAEVPATRAPNVAAKWSVAGVGVLLVLGLLAWHLTALRDRRTPDSPNDARPIAGHATIPAPMEPPPIDPMPRAPKTVPHSITPASLPPRASARTEARLDEARALGRRGMMARANTIYDELEQAGAPLAQVLLGRAELAFLRGDKPEAIRLATLSIEHGGGGPARVLLARARAAAH